VISLDLGCGSFKCSKEALGIDLRKTHDVDIVASLTKLNLKDNSVDRIYSRRCIQHIPEETLAFSEMYRVLKDQGTIKIVVASWRGWLFYQLRWMFSRRKPSSYFR
jgi:ubiquinone/menaquinone biosynthesis C-methylase UbiE